MMMKVWSVVLCTLNLASGFGYNSLNTGGSFHSSNSYSSSSSSSSNCPNQVDFSADLQLSTDMSQYPVTALNVELAARQDLTACLTREVVSANASTVPVDPTLLQAHDTCPNQQLVLASFFRYNARCWIVPAVQEVVNFTVCLSKRCQFCDNFFSGWGSETRCVRQYQYVSVWALCEGLPVLSQIVRERIILPYACTCAKVRCYSNSYFWRK